MRIVAGELRGRRFHAPSGEETRPTSDRVRESLFNLLGPLPDGALVLDLFAGTGALGMEALSRGAGHATFVESGRAALSALRRNLTDLSLDDRSLVVAADVRKSPWKITPWDYVFADPPYTAGWAPAAVFEAGAQLKPGGILTLEHAASQELPAAPEGLAFWKSRRYGRTSVTLFLRSPKELS